MYSKRKTQHAILVCIVLGYLLLATVYSVVTPLGEGPDEPGHAAYVFFLAQHNRLPVQRADIAQSDVPGEGHQPPLAYLLASAVVRWLPPEQQRLDIIGNTRFVWAGGDQTNALAHGSNAYWPWHGQQLAWHAARLVSVGLGAATVALTFGIARRVAFHRNGDSLVPLLAALLVAFNPQFLFTSALVTNDALLVASSALVLYLSLWSRGDGRWEMGDGAGLRAQNSKLKTQNPKLLLLGLALGLALITKQSAVLLIPIAAWGVIPWRARLDRTTLRHTFVRLAVVFGSAALVAGWWYARNRQLYGDLFGLEAFRAEFVTQPFDVRQPGAWLGALAQLHDSFWARFGWMNVAPPAWVIALFSLLEAVALAGWLRWLVAHRPRRMPTWRAVLGSPCTALAAFVLLAFAWLVSFALTAGLVAWQGRLVFPALPALAVLLACGLNIWLNIAREWRPRAASWSVLALAIGLFALAGWLPFGVLGPAYPNYTLPERAALAQLGTPITARFANGGEPGVQLRGWQIAGTAAPGATLHVALTWHALARQSRNWYLFMHLIDRRGEVAASATAPTKNESFPMTQWGAGDWVAGDYAIALPPDLAPGTYTLQIGLFDQNGKGRRTGVFDQNNKLRGDTFDLTTITVAQ